jgi:hypothetical protein
MSSTVPSSSLMLWLIKELVVAFLLASGGVVVLRGLWLEAYGEKEEYRDIVDFRSSKRNAARGLKWVFWGVAIEIVLTFVSVALDGWEIRQTERQIEASAPRRQPITLLSAIVEVRLKNAEQETYDADRTFMASLIFGRREETNSNIFSLNDNGRFTGANSNTVFARLKGSRILRFGGSNELRLFINFEQDPTLPDWSSGTVESIE